MSHERLSLKPMMTVRESDDPAISDTSEFTLWMTISFNGRTVEIADVLPAGMLNRQSLGALLEPAFSILTEPK